jgi:hypothetical protein
MAEEARDRYLAALDDELPMPAGRRAEVIEEISAHLDDAVADGIARGVPADRAEDDAQSRLGGARALARELARPEQTAWRLFAAAGAGLRAGVGPWVYGFFFTWLLMFAAVLVVFTIAQVASRLLPVDIAIQTTDGWNSALTALPIAVGLYFAGRAATDAVSVASRRLRSQVRPWVAGAGTLMAAGMLVLVVELPQNWPSAIALTTAPFAFALGSYRPHLLPRQLRVPWVVVIALLLLIPLGLLASAATNGERSFTEAPAERRMAIVGPQWAPDGAEPIGASGWSSDGRAVTATWELESTAQIAGLRDLRIEAWRADPDVIGALDAGWDEPFAVAGAQRDGTMVSGTVVTTQEPGISMWELFLTGVGGDGRRYRVAPGGGGNSTFTGTVWNWVVAITD